MPRYEYKCSCGAEDEISRPIANRDDELECWFCGTGKMTRLVSLTATVFKGPGWTSRGDTPAPPRKPFRRAKGYDMTGDRDL